MCWIVVWFWFFSLNFFSTFFFCLFGLKPAKCSPAQPNVKHTQFRLIPLKIYLGFYVYSTLVAASSATKQPSSWPAQPVVSLRNTTDLFLKWFRGSELLKLFPLSISLSLSRNDIYILMSFEPVLQIKQVKWSMLCCYTGKGNYNTQFFCSAF